MKAKINKVHNPDLKLYLNQVVDIIDEIESFEGSPIFLCRANDGKEFLFGINSLEIINMPTKTKTRTTIELNPGDKERLQNIALLLGIIQPTGPKAGKVGSVSRLMQAIARDEVKVIKNETAE